MPPENRHWTDDEILFHLYGVKPRPEAHLQGCGVCRERVDQVNARLSLIREDIPVTEEYLDAQRRRIHRHIETAQERRWSFRVGSALVAATAMLVIVLNADYLPRAGKTKPAISDADLYTEISDMVEQDEPRVGEPMRALFEEKQQQ